MKISLFKPDYSPVVSLMGSLFFFRNSISHMEGSFNLVEVVDEAEAKSLIPGEDGDEKADNDRDDNNDGQTSVLYL